MLNSRTHAFEKPTLHDLLCFDLYYRQLFDASRQLCGFTITDDYDLIDYPLHY
jgi:hypothetical protein